MTRVVLLANNVTEMGGAQRIVHVLAAGLAGRGHQVQAVGIVPELPGHDWSPYGYDVITLADDKQPPPPAKGWRGRLPKARAVARKRARVRAQAKQRLADLLAAGESGIIICTQVWAMEHLAEVAHEGWRVIGQYHSSYEVAARGRDLARIVASYRDVDTFAALTVTDARRFAAHGMSNAIAIPNPLAFFPDDTASPRARQITYLGRIAPEKGPAFLIAAWAQIAREHDDWMLVLVGGGPLESSMHALATRLDVAHRVRFEPAVTDVQPVLMRTGILALPSLVEGLPLALAEAMACGVACVAADCSDGVRLLIDDEHTGLIARRGDAAHLAEQLDRLINDADLRDRLGTAAREHVRQFQLDPILDRWEALFSDVLR